MLGNRHYLKDHLNDQARDHVIEANADDLKADKAVNGPMIKELRRIATKVQVGEKFALLCWCAPRRCHGNTYKDEILRIIKEELNDPR